MKCHCRIDDGERSRESDKVERMKEGKRGEEYVRKRDNEIQRERKKEKYRCKEGEGRKVLIISAIYDQ